MTRKAAQATFAPGDVVKVTNHYITREDHPCYGTRTSTVVRSTTAGLTLEPGGFTPWPKAADLIVGIHGLELKGHPNAGDLFLVVNRVWLEEKVRDNIERTCCDDPECPVWGDEYLVTPANA